MHKTSKKLLNWFKKEQRDLPWRRAYRPYEVWVSEIMLQQTQVATALPYFHQWMKELPTIEAVATAPEDKILKLWEGLGYYSRARNLQKAAKQIVEKHGGKFPEKYEDILALPGVGKYTASAIASIAFNQDYPVVDGNVIRVISRLKDFHKNTRLPENEKKFWKWADEMLPKGHARDFNQAMMEFGALVCRPGHPDCSKCPLKSDCEAYKTGTVSSLPNRGPKKKLEQITVAIGIVRKSNKIFVQKRPSKGLMGGLWEFPGGKVLPKEKPKNALSRELKEELGITVKNIKLFKKIKHGYTRFKVDLHAFEADFEDGEIQLNAASEGKWVDVGELSDYPFPAANVQLIADLQKR